MKPTSPLFLMVFLLIPVVGCSGNMITDIDTS